MKRITFPKYFVTEGRRLYHSEMGDFYGKKENFKMWHWLMRNFDKRIPDYIAYAEQYRFKSKEDFRTCKIDIEVSRCELGKCFGTNEFEDKLNKFIKSLNKRYLDSLNGVLKKMTLYVKVDIQNDIIELDRIIVNQYTLAGSEKNNDPKKQWIYGYRTIKARDFSYRFSPYIDDSKYWDVKSKNYQYLGVASFGVSDNRSVTTYRSLNKYITYVVSEIREYINSIKDTETYKN